jgi:Flp pilus assembly protein TadG
MRTNQHKNRRRGNAIVEAALAAPMLFLFLSGVVDFGRSFYFADVAAGAARAGTQYGIISSANAGNTGGMEAAARAEATGVPSNIFSVTATFYCKDSGGSTVTCKADPSYEEYVRVETHISYALIIPWPGLANPMNIGGVSVMRVQ